jgi:hypothetical protein
LSIIAQFALYGAEVVYASLCLLCMKYHETERQLQVRMKYSCYFS